MPGHMRGLVGAIFMKTILTIFLSLLLFSQAYGQENDSSVYWHFIAVDNVVDVKYARDYFANGQLKSEGWLVSEKASHESEIVKVENYGKFSVLDYKYGVWKRYHESGKIAGIDSMGNKPNSESHQYDYNKKGCLTKIVSVKEKKVIKIETRMFSGYSLRNSEWITFKYYNCDGIVKEESFSTENVKNGTWKWYKNGKLFKIKEYKDNKLIDSKKYST